MLFLLPFLLPLLLILTPIPTAAAAPAPAPAGGGNPPTPPPPATPPTWLFDLGPSKPVLDVQEFSPEQIADMTAEYQRLRRNMVRWGGASSPFNIFGFSFLEEERCCVLLLCGEELVLCEAAMPGKKKSRKGEGA